MSFPQQKALDSTTWLLTDGHAGNVRQAVALASALRLGGVRRLQLLRWPPDHLLKSDLRYLRLATTLGTRPFAIDDLAARSGIRLIFLGPV